MSPSTFLLFSRSDSTPPRDATLCHSWHDAEAGATLSVTRGRNIGSVDVACRSRVHDSQFSAQSLSQCPRSAQEPRYAANMNHGSHDSFMLLNMIRSSSDRK